MLYLNRFHLRWGCREILYDKSACGETYVTGLAISRVHFYVSFDSSGTLMAFPVVHYLTLGLTRACSLRLSLDFFFKG